jgi:hypothetical protein
VLSLLECVLTVLTKSWHGNYRLGYVIGVHKAHTQSTPIVGGVAILLGIRKLPCQVDNLKLEVSLTNFLGMNSIGATSPRDSCGLNSL